MYYVYLFISVLFIMFGVGLMIWSIAGITSQHETVGFISGYAPLAATVAMLIALTASSM